MAVLLGRVLSLVLSRKRDKTMCKNSQLSQSICDFLFLFLFSDSISGALPDHRLFPVAGFVWTAAIVPWCLPGTTMEVMQDLSKFAILNILSLLQTSVSCPAVSRNVHPLLYTYSRRSRFILDALPAPFLHDLQWSPYTTSARRRCAPVSQLESDACGSNETRVRDSSFSIVLAIA